MSAATQVNVSIVCNSSLIRPVVVPEEGPHGCGPKEDLQHTITKYGSKPFPGSAVHIWGGLGDYDNPVGVVAILNYLEKITDGQDVLDGIGQIDQWGKRRTTIIRYDQDKDMWVRLL